MVVSFHVLIEELMINSSAMDRTGNESDHILLQSYSIEIDDSTNFKEKTMVMIIETLKSMINEV